MEHPFIDTDQLNSLSMEEISMMISDLMKKQNWAMAMKNQPLASQLQMAIDSYRAAQSRKTSEMMNKNKIGNIIQVESQNR